MQRRVEVKVREQLVGRWLIEQDCLIGEGKIGREGMWVGEEREG